MDIGHTFGSYLSQAALDLDIGHERIQRWLVIPQGPQLLLKLDGEGDDICTLPAVSLNPLCDLGQVFAFLAEVVFHRKVDEVDYRLGSDEAQLDIVSIVS